MIPTGSTYVALGSSFAAGPGVPPQEPGPAKRSGRNYPHQVAERLRLNLIDVSASGSTTANILTEPQGKLPPQIEAVTADAALVTVTSGGNDVGYMSTLFQASMAGKVRKVPFTGWLRDRIDYDTAGVSAAADGLIAVVDAVRQRAPRARIVLVDYLTVLGPDAVTGPRMPLSAEAVTEAAGLAAALDAAFARAAEKTGADLVRASAASVAHGVGSPEPWITDYQWGNMLKGGQVPYHPNLAGMTAVAGLLTDLLTSPADR